MELDLIDEAGQDGFTVALHFLLVPEGLAARRVETRVASGGHSVPEEKGRQQYQRLWELVPQEMETTDRNSVYANAALKGPRIVAQLVRGIAVGGLAPADSPYAGQDRASHSDHQRSRASRAWSNCR